MTTNSIQTILDVIRDLLQRLRSYDSSDTDSPEIRHEIEEAFSEFKEGTWQYAAVRTAGNLLKASNQSDPEFFEGGKERFASLRALRTKQAAINSAIVVYEQIEKEVLDRGGKTFKELHPKFEYAYHVHPHIPWQLANKPLEFKPMFSLSGVSNTTEKRKAKYIEL